MNGKNLNNYKTESSTTVNGKIILDMETENKSGKMAQYIRGDGKTIWPMVKED